MILHGIQCDSLTIYIIFKCLSSPIPELFPLYSKPIDWLLKDFLPPIPWLFLTKNHKEPPHKEPQRRPTKETTTYSATIPDKEPQRKPTKETTYPPVCAAACVISVYWTLLIHYTLYWCLVSCVIVSSFCLAHPSVAQLLAFSFHKLFLPQIILSTS